MAQLQLLFSLLLILQFVVIVSHDWIDIRGWTHGSQVQAIVGRRKLLIATLINAIFPGAAVAFAIYWWRRPGPTLVVDYWVLYCAITMLSAVAMWYVPYLFGTNEQQKEMYAQMYAGTRHVLPPRGNNPRPNLLHLFFHALFAINLSLGIALRVMR
jgi:hypothetical protein